MAFKKSKKEQKIYLVKNIKTRFHPSFSILKCGFKQARILIFIVVQAYN